MIKALVAAILLAAGCAAAAPEAPPEAGRPKPAPPVIEKHWAPEATREGTYWRVYLAASDPDCDLAAVYVRVSQLGQAGYPLQQFNLGQDDRCRAAGQISFWLGPEMLWSARLTIEVWAKDAAGNSSRVLALPLVVDGPPEAQPPEEFRAPEFGRTLGNINIRLRSPLFDGGRPGLRGR